MTLGLIYDKKEVKLKNISESDLKFFKELLEAETIGGKEGLIKEKLVSKLEELNFSIKIDDIGNISAIRGKSDKYAMLNAHMDIVDYSWYGGYNYKQKSKSSGLKKPSYSICSWYQYSYDNEYDFYESIYTIINNTRQKHDVKEAYLKDVIENLKPFFNELSLDDLENIGVDCFYCTNTCLNTFICDKFTLNETNYASVDKFIDMLEDYCLNTMEAFIAYNEDFEDEDDYEDEEDCNKQNEEYYEAVVDLKNDKIKGKGKCRVLGGDDKCGIFIALKVAELLPDVPLKMLFTVQEESGCIGISHFINHNLDFLRDVKYSLTIDRRDGDNLLWSQCGKRSCSDEFAAKLSREGVKAGIPVKLMDGSIADVIHIRNHVPNSVNMSAGYYNAHSSEEYIIPSEVDKIIDWVKNILTNV